MFLPLVVAPSSYDKAYWFLFSKNKLCIQVSQSSIGIPLFHNPSEKNLQVEQIHYLGILYNTHCFCAEFVSATLPSDFEVRDLRTLYGIIDEQIYSIALKSFQIVNWGLTHRFCGRCGAAMNTSTTEYAKICPQCELTLYPRISPAVIIAIVRDNKILLARRKEWTMYSVIAGYVEVGETLEQTVCREVLEEVGIRVKNIKYFSNQQWAYSYSLMIGFTAEYDSGDIVPDGVEIYEAQWFSADQIPEHIPGKISIARALIDWFLSVYSK